MAGRSSTLSIRVLVDAAQGAAGLRQLGDSAEGVGDQFKKVFAAAAAFAGVTGFIKSAVDAASRLQQASGGVEAVFKGSASAVKGWATEAAQSLGLSKSAYQELATVIGSQLKNAGVAMDQLAPKTDEIIRKGADLAAMYGGTTADAVEALSSALKGEMDPVEKYGISLNQNAIKAEEMALGLDTSTTAAEQNAKAVAVMSLINKQSADSMGAAARESDSYASVMQQLNAVWENTIADVGSALLPALSSLVSTLADLAPAVGEVLTPIAELLGWLLQLPTPIQAVAAGFLLWKFTPIQGMLTSLSTAMRSATGSAGGFKTAMASVGKALAGGALIGGALLLFSELAGTISDAKAKADEFQSVVQTLGDELVKTGGVAGDAFAELQRGTIENTDAFKALTAAGISYGDSMNFFTDQSKLSSDAVDAITAALEDMDPNLIVSALAMTKSGDAAKKYATEKMAFLAAEQQATGATKDNSAATAEAAAAQQKAAEEVAKAALEAAKAAAAQTEVKTSLAGVKDAASAAATAVEYFTLQMNLAAGVNVSADQAAKLLNDTLRDTSSAFKGATDDGGYSMAALTDWNVAALTSTQRGSDIYDSLTKMQTAYATSTVTAYQNAAAHGDTAAGMTAAASAADQAYTAFIAMATEATGSSVAAEQLAAKLGIVQGTQIDPKTFELIAKDQQADQAVADLQAAQIAPKDVTVNASVQPAQGAFTQLVQQQLDNTVQVDANAKAAQGTVNDFVNAKRTATPVEVPANIQPAAQTVQTFTQTTRQATPVQVTANVAPAQQSVNQLVSQSQRMTVSVGADTGPAASAIQALVNRSYTATVNVTANVSQASAAIASVPRSVAAAPAAGVQAFSAAAAAPVAGFQPAAAPPLHALPRVQVNGGAPVATIVYNVNVSGALDADSTARQIESLLRRRQRRTGGGRMS